MKKNISKIKEFWNTFFRYKRNEFGIVFGVGVSILPAIFGWFKLFTLLYIFFGIMFIFSNLYFAYVNTYIAYNKRDSYYGFFVVGSLITLITNLATLLILAGIFGTE